MPIDLNSLASEGAVSHTQLLKENDEITGEVPATAIPLALRISLTVTLTLSRQPQPCLSQALIATFTSNQDRGRGQV